MKKIIMFMMLFSIIFTPIVMALQFPILGIGDSNMFFDKTWWINETEATLQDSSGYLAVNTSTIQNRISGVCGAGEAMTTVAEDGTITCASTSGNITGFNASDASLNSSGLKIGINESYLRSNIMNTSLFYIFKVNWSNVLNKLTNLSQYTDDLGDRGYNDLANFSNSLGYVTNSTANYTTDTYNTSQQMIDAVNQSGYAYQFQVTWANILSKFITAVDNDWIYMVGTNATFNDSKLSTTYYNVTSVTSIAGTVNGGTLYNTQHPNGCYDGVTINFTEVAATPGLDLRMNFTSISDFNGGVIRYETSLLKGETPIIQLWDYNSSSWEDYPLLGESNGRFSIIEQPVFDSTDHIDGGIIQMRLYKATKGTVTNHYYVDWVAVYKGFGTPAGEEVDPYSLHRDGGTELTANWAQGAFNFTTTDSWFLGKINASNVQNSPWSIFAYSDYFNQGLNTTSNVVFANVYNKTEVLALNTSWNYTVDTDTTYDYSDWQLLNRSGYNDLSNFTNTPGYVTNDTANFTVDTDTHITGAEIDSLVGNWSDDKGDYYTSAEVLALNGSWNYTVDTDTTYSVLSPLNTSNDIIGWISCPDTQIWVSNVSASGGWQCQAKSSSGGGTVTSVSGDGTYVTGTVTTSGTFVFNESNLNDTIDARDSDTTYDAGEGIILTSTTFSTNDTYSSSLYVNRSLWTSIDNYPSGCPANSYVQTIGDTLTCVNVVNDTDTWNTTQEMINAGVSSYVNRSLWTTIDNYPSGCAANSYVQAIGDTLTCVNVVNDTDTTYTAGLQMDLTGTVFSHNDSSSQASSDNSGRTYIQDIILDTVGHITSLTTATETAVSFVYSTFFDQDLNTTDAVTFATINTGQGANELYDMDQNVLTSSNVIFANIYNKTEVLALNTSWNYTTDTYNTTDEMQTACILLNSSWNYTTDTYNTTTEMIDAVNNTALNLVNAYGYPSSFTYSDYLDQGLNTSSTPTFAGLIAPLNWTYLQNYPTACPAGSYLTLLGDTVTCTAAMRTTGENITGNYNFTNNVTASYFIGDGSLLTGIAGGSFTYSDYFDQGLNTTSTPTFNSLDISNNVSVNGSVVVVEDIRARNFYTNESEENIIIGESAEVDSDTPSTVSIGFLAGADQDIAFGGGNVYIGTKSAYNATVQRSVIIGYEAGLYSKNAFTWYNEFIGYEAGKGYVGGGNSILIGKQAGQEATGGTLIGIGNDVLEYSDGSNVIGIGDDALRNSDSRNSVAIGDSAMESSSSEFSVGIGQAAGENNLGEESVMIGYWSGKSNKGIRSTFIGRSSGSSNTGNNSVGIGYQAVISNTGQNVTGIGVNTLNGNSGNDVIAIGYTAGQGNTEDAVFILQQSSINEDPLIYGDFVTGDINTTGSLYVGGCIYYNCSQPSGCVSLGAC